MRWARPDDLAGNASRGRRVIAAVACTAAVWLGYADAAGNTVSDLDQLLSAALKRAGFTGTIESTLERASGARRPRARRSRPAALLRHDPALHDDNTCAGCHAPAAGFGDTQSIAIGIQNNDVVGPNRAGPRNQRRTPTVVNTAFYPEAHVERPLLRALGRSVRQLAGLRVSAARRGHAFPPHDPVVTHLLIAQAHIPPTELVEVAGFTGTRGTIGPRFDAVRRRPGRAGAAARRQRLSQRADSPGACSRG